MKALKKMADGIAAFNSGLMSWLKVIVMSGMPSPRGARSDSAKLVILGNGPSLSHTLETDSDILMRCNRLAVNFAANTPEFTRLKPQFYVLADPHFFEGEESDPNVARLWQNIMKADWPMTLYVPCKSQKKVRRRMVGSELTVKGFNLTPAEGLPALVHPLYSSGLAMPRPRNVLIPSIMIAAREGFRRIYIAGADHTWSRTLEVDDQNRVVSVQPHFYKDNDSEKSRVSATYSNYRLHDILLSLHIAFRSYHLIRAWSESKGVTIYNITPGSFIDAFPRLASLPPD